MLEAKLTQGSLFKKLVDAIKELCKEVNLDCTEQSIVLQAMDSSHVSLVNLRMNECAFDKYRADQNKVLGVNMESLMKIFKLAGNDDSVTIKAEDDADVVQFIFENTKEDRLSDFSLKLMDVESEHLGIPDNADYKCIIEMPSSEFQKHCRDLKEFGDSIALACTKEGIKFTVEGDIGTGNVNVKPRAGEKKADAVTISCTEPVTLAFALRYLNFFTKATPLADTVKICLSDDSPLIVEYALGDTDSGYLRYYLAPKIDD